MKKVAATSMLAALILVQSCGGTFATSLRAILAASSPLIESLNLGENKSKVVIAFTELADDAARLSDELKACQDNPCKLTAVEKFQSDYDRISARGVFGVHPKLQKVSDILRGIILSAKIFYGGARPPSVAGVGTTPESLDAQLKALKAAMRP